MKKPKKKKKGGNKQKHGSTSETDDPVLKKYLGKDYKKEQEDPIAKKEIMTMKKLIMDKRANFSFATTSILRNLFCLRIALTRKCLRHQKAYRNDLYFKIGVEKLEKDLDIGRLLIKIRQLNMFMKMILDTDQRKLLKLRSSVLIDSAESDSKSIFKTRRRTDKGKMLDLYV